jgi:tetratricopeptide (TPR) repeat protein
VKGWFRHLAGFETASGELFRRSREEDGDVVYGWLFESMVWLSAYLEEQQLPLTIEWGGKITVQENPPETQAMKDARSRFARILDRAKDVPGWGESATKEFDEVLAGFRAFQREDMEAAGKGLTRALALPETALIRDEVHMAMAKVRFMQGAFDEAQRNVAKVLAFRPESAYAHYLRGAIASTRGNQQHVQGKDPRPAFAEAFSAFEKSLRLDPRFRTPLAGRGLTGLRLGAYEEASGLDPRPTYRRAIEDYKAIYRAAAHASFCHNLGDLHRAMARCGRRLGEDPGPWLEGSVRWFEAGLKIDPEYALTLGPLGSALLEKGNSETSQGLDPRQTFRRAIAILRQAAEKNPEAPWIHDNLAGGYIGLGTYAHRRGQDTRPLYEKAVASASEALNRDPNFTLALVTRCQARAGYARAHGCPPAKALAVLEEALADIGEALRRKPDSSDAHFQRGSVHGLLVRIRSGTGADPGEVYDRGVADFTTALDHNPRNLSALMNRGMIHMNRAGHEARRGRDPRPFYRKAIADYTEALGRTPGNPALHINRGNSYASSAQYSLDHGGDPKAELDKALADFTWVVRADPGSAIGASNCGFVLYLMGRFAGSKGRDPRLLFEKAVASYSDALRLNRDYVNAYNNRAETHRCLAIAKAAYGDDPLPAYEKALADLEEVLKRRPGQWQAHVGRGRVFEALGRFSEAIEAVQRADEITGGRVPGLKASLEGLRKKAAEKKDGGGKGGD